MNIESYKIKAVTNNQEKQNSYRENFKRYNKAKASAFYLECLWILYAMLEDRTSAFLHYLGFTSDKKRTSVTGNKKIKSEIRQILKMDEAKDKYDFKKSFGKLSRIADVISWSFDAGENITEYQKAVKKAVQKLANDEKFIKSLTYLKTEWSNKRNQLTHALFNKSSDDVIFELLPLVENGYDAVRILDNAVKRLKKENIRKRFKIQ